MVHVPQNSYATIRSTRHENPTYSLLPGAPDGRRDADRQRERLAGLAWAGGDWRFLGKGASSEMERQGKCAMAGRFARSREFFAHCLEQPPVPDASDREG